jgi:hypothetical protein
MIPAPSALDAARRVARLRLQSDRLAAQADAASLTSIRLRGAIEVMDRTSYQTNRIERSVDRAEGAKQAARNAKRLAAEAAATYQETFGCDPPDVEPEPEPTLLPPPVPSTKSEPVRCLWCNQIKSRTEYPAGVAPVVCHNCWRASNQNNPKENIEFTPSETDPPT